MKHLLTAFFFTFSIAWSLPAVSAMVDISNQNHDPIGKYIHFLKEDTTPLDLDGAVKAYNANKFTASDQSFLNFGIGSKPVWLQFDVNNPGNASAKQHLSIETSWLDQIDVYFKYNQQPVQHVQAGDRFPFSQRQVKNRYFIFEHAFQPGTTSVFIRVSTPDPMVLPVYLTSIDMSYEKQAKENTSYGFLYGGILSLLTYNLMLFFSLKSRRYLYYSLYLISFIAMNAAYTGHGFMYAWSAQPGWQQWSNPVLMAVFALSGLLFAVGFLNTKLYFPKIYRVVIYSCIAIASFQVISALFNYQLAALLVSFVLAVSLFPLSMISLGAIAYYSGNKTAKYFLIASIAHVTGAMITGITVWGLIPFSTLGYRAVDIGIMVDAILLAMALADQFRLNRDAKVQAEYLAKTDPLTELNNRRAFYEMVKPLWNDTLSNHHQMSLILIDIDKFKHINDTYGHAKGDEVLTLLAKMLLGEVRSEDILARWGGEEFIIFLPNTNLAEATAIAERFRQKISMLRIRQSDEAISLTASIGVANNDNPDMSLDALISAADKCLYSAKEQGRNRVCSDSST